MGGGARPPAAAAWRPLLDRQTYPCPDAHLCTAWPAFAPGVEAGGALPAGPPLPQPRLSVAGGPPEPGPLFPSPLAARRGGRGAAVPRHRPHGGPRRPDERARAADRCGAARVRARVARQGGRAVGVEGAKELEVGAAGGGGGEGRGREGRGGIGKRGEAAAARRGGPARSPAPGRQRHAACPPARPPARSPPEPRSLSNRFERPPGTPSPARPCGTQTPPRPTWSPSTSTP